MIRALSIVALFAVGLAAAPVTVPDATVLSTDTTSGPQFVLGSAWNPTDTLTLNVSGIVYLQSGNTYGTNAAGVVVVPGTAGTGTTWPYGPGTYGQLLLGYGSLFVPLFPADATNGLGSSNPPTTLALSGVTLSSLGFTSVIPAGTVMEFRVNDSIAGDNSGQFDVSSVPEPSTTGLLLLGLAGIVAGIKRSK